MASRHNMQYRRHIWRRRICANKSFLTLGARFRNEPVYICSFFCFSEERNSEKTTKYLEGFALDRGVRMTEYEAEVVPNQPWNEDGSANVTPKPPYPDTTTVGLPLEHREGSPLTVLRSEYPSGLVIIPYDTPPQGNSANLPMELSGGEEIRINDEGEHQSWPNGIVARFTD